MKILLGMIVLFLLSPAAWSQEFLFRVMASKGMAEVRSSSGWHPLKVGSGLSAADEVKLPVDGYVALAHQTGGIVELKTAGTYNAADLAGKVKGGGTILRKYTDFILSKAMEDRNKMIATGSVHRGLGDEVDAYLPDMKNSFLFSGKVILAWSPTPGGGPYKVSIRSQFDEELLMETVAADHLEVNLDERRFRDQDYVIVYVTSNSDPDLKSEEHMIRRMYPAEQDKVTFALTDLTAQLEGESAPGYLVQAAFYEERKLFIDAVTAYHDAIRLAPDIPAFHQAYDDFLIRNGMKSLPKE